MLISNKYLKDLKDSVENRRKKVAELQEEIQSLLMDYEVSTENKDKALKSKEMQFLSRFFKHMVVVPSQFGIKAELGRIKIQNVPNTKRFLEEKGFILVSSYVDKDICYCQYIGTEGHMLFIQFEEVYYADARC